MNKKKVFAVLFVFLLIVSSITFMIIRKHNNTVDNRERDFQRIRLNEDLAFEGNVKKANNLFWNNASITQYNRELNLRVDITNKSEEDIKEKIFLVKLLDKNGKVICCKEKNITLISANDGKITIDLKFDVDEIVVVHDIEIITK